MATVRDQIVDAAETRFRGILKSSGYRTNLGVRLRTWQNTPPRWDDLPVLQVSDPEETFNPSYGVQRHVLRLVVEAILPGDTTAADLREIAADVLQAVGTGPTWGGLAIQSRPTRIAIDLGRAEDVSAGVTVELTVDYETSAWGA